MRRAVTIALCLGLVLAACGDDAEESAATTAPAVVATTAGSDAGATMVTFDGETCSVAGSMSLESGLVEVQVLNTSPNSAEALIGRLDGGFTHEDIASAVEQGIWDLFFEDRPDGLLDIAPVRMPPNGTDPVPQSFAAGPGTWAVVCFDIFIEKAFIAPQTFEVTN